MPSLSLEFLPPGPPVPPQRLSCSHTPAESPAAWRSPGKAPPCALSHLSFRVAPGLGSPLLLLAVPDPFPAWLTPGVLCAPPGRPNVPQPVCPGVRAGGEPAALRESQAAPGQSWANYVPGRGVPCLFRGSPCPAPLAAAAPSGPRIPPAEPEVGAVPVPFPASRPLLASIPE